MFRIVSVIFCQGTCRHGEETVSRSELNILTFDGNYHIDTQNVGAFAKNVVNSVIKKKQK